MSSNNESHDAVSVKHKRNIGQFIFSALVVFAFIGVVITDISPSDAHFYWLAMLFLYASVAIYTGRKQAKIKGEKLGGLILKQMLHWGGLTRGDPLRLHLTAYRRNYRSGGWVNCSIIGSTGNLILRVVMSAGAITS